MRRLLRGLGNLALVLASVLVFEGVLQIASRLVPVIEERSRPNIPRKVEDPGVGFRGNPDYPGFDARGFRNPQALETASIVTLGDSQTYGTGVGPREAWPFLLGDRLARSVYNMGFGGYGAVHNRVHLKEALDLAPEVVIFALYFGNDFYDDFRLSLKRGELERAIGAERLAEVRRLEATTPLGPKMTRLFRRGRSSRSQNALEKWFTRTSRVYGLIRNLVRQIETLGKVEGVDALLSFQFSRAKAALKGERRAFASAFEGESWRTILTAPYRFQAMDDSDPRILAGIEAGKLAITEMSELVARAGAHFLVLLIPTKENVFRARVTDAGAHVGLEPLAATEGRLAGEIKRLLATNGIAHVDLLPILRAASEQPYFVNGNGHPNRYGHELIAEAVARALGKQGFGR